MVVMITRFGWWRLWWGCGGWGHWRWWLRKGRRIYLSLVLIVTSTNCCRHTEGLSVTEVGRVEVVVTADQNREKTKSCPKSLRRSRGNRGFTPAIRLWTQTGGGGLCRLRRWCGDGALLTTGELMRMSFEKMSNNLSVLSLILLLC